MGASNHADVGKASFSVNNVDVILIFFCRFAESYAAFCLVTDFVYGSFYAPFHYLVPPVINLVGHDPSRPKLSFAENIVPETRIFRHFDLLWCQKDVTFKNSIFVWSRSSGVGSLEI